MDMKLKYSQNQTVLATGGGFFYQYLICLLACMRLTPGKIITFEKAEDVGIEDPLNNHMILIQVKDRKKRFNLNTVCTEIDRFCKYFCENRMEIDLWYVSSQKAGLESPCICTQDKNLKGIDMWKTCSHLEDIENFLKKTDQPNILKFLSHLSKKNKTIRLHQIRDSLIKHIKFYEKTADTKELIGDIKKEFYNFLRNNSIFDGETNTNLEDTIGLLCFQLQVKIREDSRFGKKYTIIDFDYFLDLIKKYIRPKPTTAFNIPENKEDNVIPLTVQDDMPCCSQFLTKVQGFMTQIQKLRTDLNDQGTSLEDVYTECKILLIQCSKERGYDLEKICQTAIDNPAHQEPFILVGIDIIKQSGIFDKNTLKNKLELFFHCLNMSNRSI